MDLSHNQRKGHTATISEDFISAITYINTPIRLRTHMHKKMKGLPYNALDGIGTQPHTSELRVFEAFELISRTTLVFMVLSKPVPLVDCGGSFCVLLT